MPQELALKRLKTGLRSSVVGAEAALSGRNWLPLPDPLLRRAMTSISWVCGPRVRASGVPASQKQAASQAQSLEAVLGSEFYPYFAYGR
jgi:hypothetical protein